MDPPTTCNQRSGCLPLYLHPFLLLLLLRLLLLLFVSSRRKGKENTDGDNNEGSG